MPQCGIMCIYEMPHTPWSKKLYFLQTLTDSIIVGTHYMPFCLQCCWLGSRKGIRPVKTWEMWYMAICLGRGADLHTAQLMPLPFTVSCTGKIQMGFTFLVPAHLDSPGKKVTLDAIMWYRVHYTRCHATYTVTQIKTNYPPFMLLYFLQTLTDSTIFGT